MKTKIFYVLSILAFGTVTYFLMPKTKTVNTLTRVEESENSDVQQKNIEKVFPEITYAGTAYNYTYTKILGTLRLVPNFGLRLSSSEIVDKYGCDYGINAGFYTKEDTPLGLFYSEGKYLGQKILSNTFDAYFAKNTSSDKPEILSSIDMDNVENSYDFIFQTGPLYDLDLDFTDSFVDKQYARRNLIARDSEVNYYFFSIFSKESRYSGPRLEDIPNIFKSTDFQKMANFVEVLNLDGGSASSFYDREKNTKVGEIIPIGSFLCGSYNQSY